MAFLDAPWELLVTLGGIARIMRSKGQVDEALKLHQEMMGIFESLGDQRSRAVTLGDIAQIMRPKGQVDEALKLHQEKLGIMESLGDQDGKANALWSMAQIQVQRQEWQAALDGLAESYAINRQIGRLDGICFVGLDLGRLLCAGGRKDEGLEILERSQAGFAQLGQTPMAERAAQLIRQIREPGGRLMRNPGEAAGRRCCHAASAAPSRGFSGLVLAPDSTG